MKFGMHERKHRNKLIIFTLVSLSVHILVLFFAPLHLPQKKTEEQPIYVEIDPKVLDQLADDKSKKQIVNTEESDSKIPPKDAKFLSDKSQSVAEETKAKSVEEFQKGGAKGERALSLKSLAPKPFTAQPSSRDSSPRESGDMQDAKQQQQQAQMQAGDGGNARGSSNNDYLKDVKEGNRTVLNTKEFVYFGYYHRIRQRLERSWKSKLHSAIEGQVITGRQLASEKAYITKLVVVLDRHGRITGVQLMDNSGSRELDRAAVDAFNQAGPFPDPPSGLIDENGQIKISWDFVLQT